MALPEVDDMYPDVLEILSDKKEYNMLKLHI